MKAGADNVLGEGGNIVAHIYIVWGNDIFDYWEESSDKSSDH